MKITSVKWSSPIQKTSFSLLFCHSRIEEDLHLALKSENGTRLHKP